MRFDRVLADQIWNAALTESDVNRRGRLLELLVAYCFVSLASYDARMRIRGLDSEVDLILRGKDPDSHLQRELGTYVLVECKNTDRAVGSSEIRNFSAKVRYAGCSAGVLVAREGLTGTRPGAVANATYAVRKAYHRDGTVLIVVTGDDLRKVIDGRTRFVDLLEQRYEEIRFDLTYKP